MIEENQLNKIKEFSQEFFDKMTMAISNIEISCSSGKDEQSSIEKDVVNLEITGEEPQILIGQQGQTLFEIQRILRTILNKKLQNIFYLNLDINGYKKKKMEYLKDVARDLADQVSLTKEAKILPPMSSYERRVVHSELSQRTDITTESHGEGPERHIIIKPK